MFRNKQNKLNTAILLMAVAAVVFISPVAAEEPELGDLDMPEIDLFEEPILPEEPYLPEDPHLSEGPQMPGTVEGTGTYFEVADSNYIDITFESTEPPCI